MEFMPDTFNWVKIMWLAKSYMCPKEEPNTTILLSGHSNKLPTKIFFFTPVDYYISQSLSEKLLFLVDGS